MSAVVVSTVPPILGLLAHAPVPIYAKDLEGRYVFVNAAWARAFGVETAAASGRTDRELFTVERADLNEGRHRDTLAMGAEMRYDEVVEVDGAQRSLTTIEVPLWDESGAPSGVFGIASELTARIHAYEEAVDRQEELELEAVARSAELEAANRELQAFAYSVSHDLRAPLRAIDGFSRILLEDHGDRLDDEGRRLLHTVRDAAVEMGELIGGLLSFSRLANSPFARGAVDPGGLVASVVRDLQFELAGRTVDFCVDPLPEVTGDAVLVRQVFANLVANAVKFTRDRPVARIHVGAEEHEGEPVLFVRDNGVGFDQQYADKLFGLFQRLHRAEDFPGTGIGLALAARIVHRHGGRIWAEGTDGEGATFFFTLGGATP